MPSNKINPELKPTAHKVKDKGIGKTGITILDIKHTATTTDDDASEETIDKPHESEEAIKKARTRKRSVSKSNKKPFSVRFKKCFFSWFASFKLQGVENYLFAFGSWEIMEKNNGKISKLIDYLVYRIMELITGIVITVYYAVAERNLEWYRPKCWNQFIHLLYSGLYAFNVLTEDKFRHRVAAARNEQEYLTTLNTVTQGDTALKATNLPLTKLNQAVWLLGMLTWNAKLTTITIDFYYLGKRTDTRFDLTFFLYNFIGIWLDVFFTSFPVRFVHIVYPWAYVFIYTLFSYTYETETGRPVFTHVKGWGNDHDNMVLLTGVILVLAAVIQFVLCSAAKLRDLIMTWCGDVKESVYDSESSEEETFDKHITDHSHHHHHVRDVEKGGQVKRKSRRHGRSSKNRKNRVGNKLIEIEELENGVSVKRQIHLRDMTEEQVNNYLDTHPNENRIEFVASHKAALKEEADYESETGSLNSAEERQRQIHLDMIRLRFQQAAKTFISILDHQKEGESEDENVKTKQLALDSGDTKAPKLSASDTAILKKGKKEKSKMHRGDHHRRKKRKSKENEVPLSSPSVASEVIPIDNNARVTESLPVISTMPKTNPDNEPEQALEVESEKKKTKKPKSKPKPLRTKPAHTDLSKKLDETIEEEPPPTAPTVITRKMSTDRGDQAEQSAKKDVVVHKVKTATALTSLSKHKPKIEPKTKGTTREDKNVPRPAEHTPKREPKTKGNVPRPAEQVQNKPSKQPTSATQSRRILIVHTTPSKPDLKPSIAVEEIKRIIREGTIDPITKKFVPPPSVSRLPQPSQHPTSPHTYKPKTPEKRPAFSLGIPTGRFLPPPKPFILHIVYPSPRPSFPQKQKELKRLSRPPWIPYF